jgi:DNA-binding transcriptional regulator YhcF (GntR family)
MHNPFSLNSQILKQFLFKKRHKSQYVLQAACLATGCHRLEFYIFASNRFSMSLSKYKIDENVPVPKYRQIINNIIDAIEQGTLQKGSRIPSINQIADLNSLSRDTVLMAFNELKARRVIASMPGKGYFIENTNIEIAHRIFVLFDELNTFKEDLYNSFLRNVDENTDVDIYFHHFNFQVFSDLIRNAAGKYTSYVLMPATFDNTLEVVAQLPADRVYILDRLKEDLKDYPSIYQDFENDVYEALCANEELFHKYRKLIMVYPGGKEPEGRVTGFEKFCSENKYKFKVIRNFEGEVLERGNVYFIPSDRSLVKVIKDAATSGLALGKEIGIVSFNDMVLKEVVAGGISTISTNFVEMGALLAGHIRNKSKHSVRNPWSFRVRASL